jgi:hypothetical protein
VVLARSSRAIAPGPIRLRSRITLKRRGTAIDVGASLRIYSDRLSRLADWTYAYEAHPRLARVPLWRWIFQCDPIETADIYEQEADRISDQVVRMPDPQPQRGATQLDHERLQTKPVQAGETGPIGTPRLVQEVVAGPGQPLDPATRSFMESRFCFRAIGAAGRRPSLHRGTAHCVRWRTVRSGNARRPAFDRP